MTDKIRIWRVTYKSVRRGRRRQIRRVVVKVPYGGAYAMTELLTRMVAIEQIAWYEVAAATAGEIASAKVWPGLMRWLDALTDPQRDFTGVKWTT